MERPDGSCEWHRYKNGTPHHDLAHFVVETHYKISYGFYGEILHGSDFDKMTSNAVVSTQTWKGEIFLAEALANFFQRAAWGDFNLSEVHEYYEAGVKDGNQQRVPMIIKMREDDFLFVKSEVVKLWAQWDDLQPGDSLHLVFCSAAK